MLLPKIGSIHFNSEIKAAVADFIFMNEDTCQKKKKRYTWSPWTFCFIAAFSCTFICLHFGAVYGKKLFNCKCKILSVKKLFISNMNVTLNAVKPAFLKCCMRKYMPFASAYCHLNFKSCSRWRCKRGHIDTLTKTSN